MNNKYSKTNIEENKNPKYNNNTEIENKYPLEIKGLIKNLRLSIDLMNEKFETARSMIKELARRLDESNICKRDEISRKIKEILKDKIKERKITEKWIEDCLDPEYKRKYEKNKSEVTSLSKKEKEDHKEIMIANDGSSVNEDNSEEESTKISDESKSDNIFFPNQNSIKELQEEEIEHPLALHEDISREQQLEDALLSNSLIQSADKVRDFKVKVFKKDFPKITNACASSDKFFYIVFHGYDKIASILLDGNIEDNQDHNSFHYSNNRSDQNDSSNDNDTY